MQTKKNISVARRELAGRLCKKHVPMISQTIGALFEFVGETSKEHKKWRKNRVNDVRSYLGKYTHMRRPPSRAIPENIENISTTLKTLKSRDLDRGVSLAALFEFVGES